MATTSDLYIGRTFDPVKYEILEEAVLRKHPEVVPPNEPETCRQRQDVSRFRTFKSAVKQFAKKTKVAVTRLLRGRTRETSRGCNTFAESGAIYEEQHKNDTPIPKLNNLEEQKTSPRSRAIREEFKSDENRSSQEIPGAVWTTRRYKYIQSSDYDMPTMKPGHVRKLALWLEQSLNSSLKTPTRQERPSKLVVSNVSVKAQNHGEMSKQEFGNNVENVSGSVPSKVDGERPDFGLQSANQPASTTILSIPSEDPPKLKNDVISDSTKVLSAASIKVVEAARGDVPANDTPKAADPERPESVENTTVPIPGTGRSNIWRAAHGYELVKPESDYENALGSQAKPAEKVVTDAQTEGAVSVGQDTAKKEEHSLAGAKATKTAAEERAERIQRRRRDMKKVRSDRKAKLSAAKGPSDGETTAGSVPQLGAVKSSANERVVSDGLSAAVRYTKAGSSCAAETEQYRRRLERLMRGLGDERPKGTVELRRARSTEPEEGKGCANGAAPSDKSKWAREMAIRAAEVQEARRKERIMHLLKRAFEEASPAC